MYLPTPGGSISTLPDTYSRLSGGSYLHIIVGDFTINRKRQKRTLD